MHSGLDGENDMFIRKQSMPTMRLEGARLVSLITLSVSLLILAVLPSVATAAPYPDRPLEMIVNFGPGGGADQMGRTMAHLLSHQLHVPVAVANIAGAAGNTGLTQVANGDPDGYTIGTITGISVSAWAAGLGHLKPSSLSYIAVVQSTPSMLFVPEDSRFKTYSELLKYVKQHPNKLRVATAGYGTIDDITLHYLASLGYHMRNVPYSHPGERYTSVLGGHTDAIYEQPGDVRQFIDSNQYRPLVVFGPKRLAAFPNVPASAQFHQNIDLPLWRGLVAPAGLPHAKLAKLNKAVLAALKTPAWHKFCERTYTCIAGDSPAKATAFVKTNYAVTGQFLTRFGLMER